MNFAQSLHGVMRRLYATALNAKRLVPRSKCNSFNASDACRALGSIYVINLDRQPARMADILSELDRVVDAANASLARRVVRFAAIDGQSQPEEFGDPAIVEPTYTLGDQLFVEPQPQSVPDDFDLCSPIRMTRAEIAVACSHVEVWKKIAASDESFALVLEDDVWFEVGFGRAFDRAWREAVSETAESKSLDILYVSYKEVRHGAPKTFLGEHTFIPARGLWFLSGYVLSKRGAQKLLDLLPCKGPIDLWINHKFDELNVAATRRPLVHQRRDLPSTNSYSVLPSLAKIGVLNDGGETLFNRRPTHGPVFAFGPPGSGLTSLAVALSMLGYRCCSDIDELPSVELSNLLERRKRRIFDAYVNVSSLERVIPTIRRNYPGAKFILLGDCSIEARSALAGADVLHLTCEKATWRSICGHLKVAPPDAIFPRATDIGIRRCTQASQLEMPARSMKWDTSPWVARPSPEWRGIDLLTSDRRSFAGELIEFREDFARSNFARWIIRNDTFPGNLGLFRPQNVRMTPESGLELSVMEKGLGVRNLSAGALTSRAAFQFGRFEATLKASSVRGIVTGFFLHRNSPRQEIDVEILGNRPNCLLTNVFYNPGDEGAKYDYGYRGTPVLIELGFDASEGFHCYGIEWNPTEIRWYVDGRLVHRRLVWDPTPIPQLPMQLHLNIWPTRSSELAGRLAVRELPASSILHSVSVSALSSGAGSCETEANEAVRGSPETFRDSSQSSRDASGSYRISL